MPARKWKVYFDKKKRSNMTTERYSNTKFDGKEHRSAGDNKIDLDAEPCQIVNGVKEPLVVGYTGTTYKVFKAMIRPAFSADMTDPDIDAILRRTQVYVNTKWWLYVRPAGVEDEVVVRRYKMETKMFIKPECLPILKKFGKTGEMLPLEERERMKAEELAMYKELLYKGPVVDINPQELDAEASSSDSRRAKLHQLLDVKLDLEEEFHALHQGLSDQLAGSSIDVDADELRVFPSKASSARTLADTRLCEKHQELATSLAGEAIDVDYEDQIGSVLLEVEDQENALPQDLLNGLPAEEAEEEDVFGFATCGLGD